ncbi:hypothetical protein F4553_001983 [Allocatelliglobosispora scoriae]|uniref:Uncharacterized protein n=1 Tax=Allocatelliglobosispora scoriae TaxID=643052 RepID=A0A841BK08_9ACTN|nr:hypothetical protein [Allocatelliglobosispora scoriae]MBB5868604.1 hypothetical protein [Allocatelliglobosispora scoriae]
MIYTQSVRGVRREAGGGLALHLVLDDFADSATPSLGTGETYRAALCAGIAALNAERAEPACAVLFRERPGARAKGPISAGNANATRSRNRPT